jgi:hypothetical protein
MASSVVVLAGLVGGVVALSPDGAQGPSGAPPQLDRARAEARAAPPSAFRNVIVRSRLLRELDRAGVAAADGSFGVASARLELLKRRLDGCDSSTGIPDANDWIVDCAVQVRIRRELAGAVDSLAP